MVRGLRRLRIGAIGARPAAFNTVRYSEKLLEASGISVEPIDLSEILGRIERMKDRRRRRSSKLAAIKKYVSTDRRPPKRLMKMAKLGAVIDGWMEQTDVAISAVQCWTSIEEYFGVVPCTVMSMMSDEPDVQRLRSGYLRRGRHARAAARLRNAQRAARLEQQLRRRSRQGRLLPLQQPAQALLQERAAWISRRSSPAPWASENTFGTCVGRVKASPMSFARFSTNDREGTIAATWAKGDFTDDPLETFGGAGVVKIPQPAGPAALHLRERLRAPRRRQPVQRSRRGPRSRRRAISAGTCHHELGDHAGRASLDA